MCRLHPDHIAYLEKAIAELEGMIEAKMQPFLPARDLLMTIPGIARLSAAAVICETGPAPRQYFPSAGHLASWAGLCPGNRESAGKRYSGRRRHGNVHLQSTVTEIAWAAVRHDGYLKSLYHRHVVRNGGCRSKAAGNKAIFTVAHAIIAIIAIIWNMLGTGTPYEDLGAGYCDRPPTPSARHAASSHASRHSASTSPWATPPDLPGPVAGAQTAPATCPCP